MNVLGRIFLNSRKERRKDVKTERRKDGVFLWDVEELTFLIIITWYFFSKDSFLSVFDKPAPKKAKYKKEDSIEADEDTIDRETRQ